MPVPAALWLQSGKVMTKLVTAQNLSKRYGTLQAVDQVSFSVEEGRIVGLFGPNGAGKTTLLKALLGLTDCDGELSVLGLDPFRQRRELLNNICYIADVAVLPRWMQVSRLIDVVEATHPRFSRRYAEELLSRTVVRQDARVRELSKGMVTQLHLCLITAIDARLLILDEPTLGLDILFRKEFYGTLLAEYFDEQRTILIATHQVEEIENILTDILFIHNGRLLLDAPMESLGERYLQLVTSGDKADTAHGLRPLCEREVFGKRVMTFEDIDRTRLETLGELSIPSVADLFVAKVKGAAL